MSQMFGLTAVSAVLTSMLLTIPHIGIAITPVLALAISIYSRMMMREYWARSARLMSSLCIFASAIFLYLVSYGPVIAMDFATLRMGPQVFRIVYLPVFLLHQHKILHEQIEWYSIQWGWE